MLNGDRNEQLLLLVLLLGATAVALILRSYRRLQPNIWKNQEIYPAKKQQNADHNAVSRNETYSKHNANGRGNEHSRWKQTCALFTIIREKSRTLFPIVLIRIVHAWDYAWNCVKALFCAIRSTLCWLAISFRNPDNLPAYLTGAFTLALAIFAYNAWNESIRGTAALQEQATTLQGQLNELKAEARPWVTALNQITTMQPLTFDDAAATFYFRLTIKNGGKSLATRIVTLIEAFAKPLPPEFGDYSAITPRRAFAASQCTPGKVISFAQTSGDSLVFPGDAFPLDIHQAIGKTSFVLNPETKDVSIWMTICLGYMDEAGVPHATSFVIYYVTDSGANHFAPVGQPSGRFRIDLSSFEVH
jgi:hypothetical protein